MDDVHEKLRQRLDDMGTGFPATQSGIEIKILKQLFTEADAKLFLLLSPMLETPDSIAERLNLPLGETAGAPRSDGQAGSFVSPGERRCRPIRGRSFCGRNF